MTTTTTAVEGLTYRQLDYWTRRGYLQPKHQGGTGHRREWSAHELAVANMMIRFVDAGLTVETAARAARRYVEQDPAIGAVSAIPLGPDVWVAARRLA